jgi:hypothetical protein
VLSLYFIFTIQVLADLLPFKIGAFLFEEIDSIWKQADIIRNGIEIKKIPKTGYLIIEFEDMVGKGNDARGVIMATII